LIKSRYKIDLRALHALCEANYARVLRLFPDYESRNATQFSVGAAKIHIDVLERSRYTTLFRLRCYRAGVEMESIAETTAGSRESAESDQAGWLAPLKLEARAYHDAGMLEVVAFQSGGKTQGRYTYPNPSMHQQDEKRQQNSFLADWLSHCLHHGEADIPAFLNPGTEHA
jgi:uncharacterized protein YqiB (DUF1249 family)